MIGRVRWPAVFLGALCAGALAYAQSTADSAVPATIHVTSRIVDVDVVVRDRGGRIVHGLTRQDFRVEEDGKPQTIEYFDEHTYDLAAAEKMPKLTPGTERSEFSNVPAMGAIAGSLNVILFDLFNTPSTDQLYALQQLIKFLKTMPQGQQAALFVLGDRLDMVQDFTDDSDRLVEAAQKIHPRDFGLLNSGSNGFAASLTQAAGPNLTGHSLGGSQGCENCLLIRTSSTVAAFSAIARATRGYPRRKNLFWLSDSFPIALGSQLDATKFSIIKMTPGAREMANLVADSQIAVFPISLNGQVGHSVSPVVSDMARETGGEVLWGSNDLAREIRQGMGDESNYYTLSYRPQNPKWNKQFRTIRVKITKNGYSLAYQRGYFAFPDESHAATSSVQELDAALLPESPESTLLLLHSKVELPAARPGSVIAHSVIDAGNLGLVTETDGHRHGQLLVRLIAFNDTPGAARDQPDAPPQTSGVLNLDFDPAQYQAVLKNGLAFTQALKLAPGCYRLRLGVSDMTNHRIGTLDMPIQVSPAAAVR